MTNKRFLPLGFSLIDLLIAMFVGSVLLIGGYKVFISNVQTTSGTIDLASLDSKTRKVIELLKADIADLNGNIINGIPTLVPIFNGTTSISGFVMIKPKKGLPILNLNNPYTYGDASIDLINKVTETTKTALIGPNSYGILYNFANYSWRLLEISAVETLFVGGEDITEFTLDVTPVVPDSSSWSKYISSSYDLAADQNKFNCPISTSAPYIGLRTITPSSDFEKTCDTSGRYQTTNTVFIVADIIRYELNNGTLRRIVNEDTYNAPTIATNVAKFVPSFTPKPNLIYPSAPQITITKIGDIKTYIDSLIPDNAVDTDDCDTLLSYFCKYSNKTSLTPIAYAYFSTQVSSLDIALRINTDSRSGKEIKFKLALEDNTGNSGFAAFNPTKIVASRDIDARPYGSMIANPHIYKDPSGGSSFQYFSYAVAPMVSAVYKDTDPASYNKLLTLCTAGCVPPACPAICNQNDPSSDPTKLDYLECLTSPNPLSLGCHSPQGSLNDRGLAAGSATSSTDNRLHPKIVFLDQLSQVNFTYDLNDPSGTYDSGNKCTASSNVKCAMSNYWSTNTNYKDAVFPMTVFPLFDDGVLKRLYIGTARMRNPDSTAGQFYYPYYHSTVVALNVEDPTNPTDTVISKYKSSPSVASESTYQDIASVSALQIRKEDTNADGTIDNQYMYLSSHEADKVLYRKRTASSMDDSTWSDVQLAFADSSDPNFKTNPVKYAWQYQTLASPESLSLSGGSEQYTRYPETGEDWATSSPYYEKNRITCMLAHKDGRIYYATAQPSPDELIDGGDPDGDGKGNPQGYFYTNAITYTKPIIRPENNKMYTCDPNGTGENSINYTDPAYPSLGKVCEIPAGTAKPIDWEVCLDHLWTCALSTSSSYDFWSPHYPVTTQLLPNYSAKLKVAFKVPGTENDWVIKTIADVHDTCTALTEDPVTGDLVIGGSTNIKTLSYEEINKNLESNTVSKVDLGWKRSDGAYTANNVVSQLMDKHSQDTYAGSDLEFKRLSGLNVYPDSSRLNIIFTDMVRREYGYIIQDRNLDKKRLYAQVIANADYVPMHIDRNLDDVAVYTKGLVDMKENFETWVLPYTSTAGWSDVNYESRSKIPGNWKAPVAGPIPLRPSSNITDYSAGALAENHKRELSSDPTACYTGTNDPDYSKICPGGNCKCGQDPLYRSCEADVLSQTSIGLTGRQMKGFGCGLGSPAPDYSAPDPFTPVYPPESGGTTSTGGSTGGTKPGTPVSSTSGASLTD